MEKQTPHRPLAVVSTPCGTGKSAHHPFSRTGATAMGMDYRDMLETVKALTPADFYKSMTTYADHKIWQDVYRPSTPVGGEFSKQVNAAIVDPSFIAKVRKKTRT